MSRLARARAALAKTLKATMTEPRRIASCASTPPSTENSTPMSALELERDDARRPKRSRPNIAGSKRCARRSRRHVPREAAPQALADRIAALAAPVATDAFPLARVLLVGAGLERRRAPRARGLVRPRLRRRRRGDVTEDAGRFARRRRKPRVRFRPRGNRRPALRRRLVRPPHGEALARRPHHRQRLNRRSREPGLPARGRARRRWSTGFRRRPSSTGTTSISSPSPNCRSGAGAREAGGPVETIDGYHVARWADANLAYVAVSDMDEKTLAEFVAAFRQAHKPAAEEKR